MQRALAEVLILAVACGPLGVWVLLYRQSYAAESLSHAMLPGLVVASLAGASLLLGAAAGVLVAAAAIALAGRDERLGGDVGVAVAIASLFGLGALLALSPDVPARLGELLFGDLLGVTARRPARGGGAGRGRGASRSCSRHRRLALSAFDRAAAPSLGARPGALGADPARAARRLHGGRRARARQPARGGADPRPGRRRAQPACGGCRPRSPWPPRWPALAGVLGLLASYHLDIAAGASVALAAVALFASLLMPDIDCLGRPNILPTAGRIRAP